MTAEGKELLRRGPVLNVWRAPLANDTDPWSSWLFCDLYRLPGMGKNHDGHWRSMASTVFNINWMISK